MGRDRGLPIPLETVRYAGVNRLCVELMYKKQGGYPPKQYIIEPYSLRRTRDGHLVLYGIRSDIQQDRSFRVDWIEGISVTNKTFQPRYQIEFSQAVPIHAPGISRVRRRTRLPRSIG